MPSATVRNPNGLVERIWCKDNNELRLMLRQARALGARVLGVIKDAGPAVAVLPPKPEVEDPQQYLFK